jgi:hypothetical protein
VVYFLRGEINMCCKNFGKKFAPFVLTFLLGLLAVSLLHRENPANTKRENTKPLKETVGSGGGSGDGTSFVEQTKSGTGAANRSGMNNVLIHSTPRADYTDEARQNDTQGGKNRRGHAGRHNLARRLNRAGNCGGEANNFRARKARRSSDKRNQNRRV